MKRIWSILAFIWIVQLVNGQVDKYKTGFISPMDISMYLSGNFGELRSGHFHTGIDIKTGGRNGVDVRSIDDGWLVRVFVSPGGYGKALYVNHPNGMTSVYGHLDRFSEKVDSVVKRIQYENESFSLNHFFKPEEITFKKGEVIAKSGNSGSSGGPHLHFEIRDTKTEEPLNPLHFGMTVKDETRPQIKGLKLYPIPGEGMLNQSGEAQFYSTVFYGDAFHLKGSPGITAYGKIGVGIETFDYLTGDWSKCGTYSADLYLDDELLFCWKMERLSFDELRYINTFCDYSTWVNSHHRISKLFKDEPNNKLSNYCNGNNGILDLSDGKVHNVKIVTHDVYGNRSDVVFKIQSNYTDILPDNSAGLQYFKWDRENYYFNESFSIKVPPGALYNDMYFNMEQTQGEGLLSDIYKVHSSDVALHKPVSISIEPYAHIKQDKLYMATLTKTGRLAGSAGGVLKDGKLTATTRSFGYYAVARDSIAPEIRSLDVSEGRGIYGRKHLRFKITDEGSGIEIYEGKIDGKWILMDYDAKKNMLTYEFDPARVKCKSEHKLMLKVTDYVGNTEVFVCSFKW